MYEKEALVIVSGGLVTDVSGVERYDVFDWDMLDDNTYEDISSYLVNFPGGEQFTVERVEELSEVSCALELAVMEQIVDPLIRAYNQANSISDAEN